MMGQELRLLLANLWELVFERPGDGAVQHGSQFVIAVGPMFDATQLVVFGRVIRGMDVVDRLEADDRIRSIRVAKDVNGKEIRRNHAYNPHQSRLK